MDLKFKTTTALIAALALALPASAGAHVTLQPSEAAAGDYVVVDVRVPNERDDAATTKVQVQLPPGFVFASYQPVSGWSVRVRTEKLAQPKQTDDGPITSEVREMTWSADNDAAGIQPGQFQDFPISVQVPGKAGDTLTFKALQTYDNGEVVRWIGAPDAAEPAPQVAVTAGGGEHGAVEPSEVGDSDSASKGLGIAALVAGALGLLLGAAALVGSRRRA